MAEGRSSDPSSTHPGSRRGQNHGHRVRMPAGVHTSAIKRAHMCARIIGGMWTPAGPREYFPQASTREALPKRVSRRPACEVSRPRDTHMRATIRAHKCPHTMCAHNARTQCTHTMCAHEAGPPFRGIGR